MRKLHARVEQIRSPGIRRHGPWAVAEWSIDREIPEVVGRNDNK